MKKTLLIVTLAASCTFLQAISLPAPLEIFGQKVWNAAYQLQTAQSTNPILLQISTALFLSEVVGSWNKIYKNKYDYHTQAKMHLNNLFNNRPYVYNGQSLLEHFAAAGYHILTLCITGITLKNINISKPERLIACIALAPYLVKRINYTLGNFNHIKSCIL